MHPILTQMRDEAYADAGAGWKVTRDHLYELDQAAHDRGFDRLYTPDANAVGTVGPHTAPPIAEWKIVCFRLYDDDMELYYSGFLNDDDECVSQVACLEWGMSYAGCTHIHVKRGAKWEEEIA